MISRGMTARRLTTLEEFYHAKNLNVLVRQGVIAHARDGREWRAGRVLVDTAPLAEHGARGRGDPQWD